MTTGGVVGTALASAVGLTLLGILGLPQVAGGAALVLVLAAAALLKRTRSLPKPAPTEGTERSLKARLRPLALWQALRNRLTRAAWRQRLRTAALWKPQPRDLSGAPAVRVAIAAVGTLPLLHWALVETTGLPLTVEGSRLWPWRAETGVASGLAAVLFLSSLIDWTYVRPALEGERGHRTLPCRSSMHERWRDITRRWLAHRVVAYLVLRLAVALALVLVALAVVLSLEVQIKQTGATILAAVLGTGGTAILVIFLNRFIPVLTVVSNPPLQVGDTVVLAEEYGAGLDARPAYYVVDVSIEGIKLLELDSDGRPRGTHARSHDRSLSVADAPRLLRYRQPFTGCADGCCRANPYCPLEVGQRPGSRAQ